MTRRKAPQQIAPQTLEEAVALLADYADILTGIEELRADADSSIAAIEAERDRMIAPLEQRAKDIFLQLRAWWGVAGDEITDGKRKSVELAGCMIGVRTTPKSVSIGKLKVGEAIGRLVSAGLAQLIRWKGELNKPEILKALDDEAQRPKLEELGIRSVQKEEFFIDRSGPKAPAVEEVALPEAAE